MLQCSPCAQSEKEPPPDKSAYGGYFHQKFIDSGVTSIVSQISNLSIIITNCSNSKSLRSFVTQNSNSAYYCDEPTVPEAMFNPGGRVVAGTVVMVMCVDYTRYSLVGSSVVTCSDSGTWSNLPECRLCGRTFSSFKVVLK